MICENWNKKLTSGENIFVKIIAKNQREIIDFDNIFFEISFQIMYFSRSGQQRFWNQSWEFFEDLSNILETES